MITNVCVLDSGVNLNHKRIHPNRHKFILYDVVDNEIKQVNILEDRIGHGTAVSAILSSSIIDLANVETILWFTYKSLK